ncbi:MAG: hypothetical protein HMLIMOIP_000160 [Candidatus Nitrosomirales archaeon]|jgi:hypothetical protein
MSRTRKDPKSKQFLVIVIGGAIIAVVIGISFVLMTQATDSENYVKSIQSISDQSRAFTQSYETSIGEWQDGEINSEEMLQITDNHLENLNGLLAKLRSMEPPEKFRLAHELSILSLSHELQSDEHMRNYIETGSDDEYDRSVEFLQKAYDYETQAFEEFSRAGKST